MYNGGRGVIGSGVDQATALKDSSITNFTCRSAWVYRDGSKSLV